MAFRIQVREINQLDPYAFADVMNQCLEKEAARIGLPPSKVQTNLQVTEPDGGIDARVLDAVAPRPSRIPSGTSVWQYKSGDILPSEIKGEFEKPGVQKAVRQGAVYCLAVGRDYAGQARNRREKAITSCFAELKLQPNYQFLTASDVARWASNHLGLLLFFQHPIGGIMSFDRWSQATIHQIPFHWTDDRQVIATEMQNWAQRTGMPIHQRIQGPAGVGKTRLALESLRPKQLADLTYYAPQPNDVDTRLFSWVEDEPGISFVLVVDECDREKERSLVSQAERCDGRVRLVTVHGAPSWAESAAAPDGVHLVRPLGREDMQMLLRTAFKTLHQEATRWVARWAGGYVTLARALAEAIQMQPELAGAARLARDFKVREILETLLPDENEQKAMKVVALLTRVGWEGEVAAEGQAVAEFISIAWSDAQDIVHRKQEQGLVQKQGRYRYVTPHILAIWLASEVWNARGDDTLRLLEKLPSPPTRRALLERLADFGDDERAKSVARTILGPHGPFPDLASIDDPARAEILGMLAIAEPLAGLKALERLLSHLPPDELRCWNGGRREVVWTLQKLAWHRDTFFGAGRLLLALAEAENESFANNATGVWTQLFQTSLGGTEVPALERHRLIKEALDSPSVERRLLGVQAISLALVMYEIRDGEPEHQRGRLVPPEWHPRTRKQDLEVRVSALRLLDKASEDEDQHVVMEARHALLQSARALVAMGLAAEALARLESLTAETHEEKREIREALEDILQFDRVRLTQEQQDYVENMCQNLVGTSYGDRLRRWAGKWTHADWIRPEDEKARPQEEMAALAAEGLGSPGLLEGEFDWLASPEAENVWFFAHGLGERDSEHEWLTRLLEYARQGQGLVLLAGYLAGRAQAGADQWREDILDEWADKEPSLAQAVYEATWRGKPSDRGAERLVRLVEPGGIQASQLAILAWGEWILSLSAATSLTVIVTLAEDESDHATEQALGMVRRRVYHHPEEKELISRLAWELLSRPVALASNRDMLSYHWAEVAAIYLNENPVRLARLVISGIRDHRGVYLQSDRRVKALASATKAAPQDVWGEISKALLSRSPDSYRVEMTLRGWYANLLDTELLVHWARDNRPDGPAIVARMCPVGDTPLSEPARSLLIEFGDDEHVESRLAASFLSGSFSGPMSDWYQNKLDQAKVWMQDDNANVRRWARHLVTDLERDIDRTRLQEEESEF